MIIDTASLVGYASRIRRLRCAGPAEASVCGLHLEIQNSLARLEAWFQMYAQEAERTEQLLTASEKIWKPSPLTVSHTETWNLGQQLQKRSVESSWKASASGAWRTAQFHDSGNHHDFQASVSAGSFATSGSASVRLWKNKIFSPSAQIKAEASASVLKAEGTLKVFSGSTASMNLNAKGEAGAAYARAEAVVSADEQTLDLGVGAAALRGECTLAFSLLGATVTLSGQGTIGSAEASLSYRHKNREWEFGSKLGFIAGLGFKIRVSY